MNGNFGNSVPSDVATLSVVSHGHGILLHQLLADLSAQEGIGNCQIIVTLNLQCEVFDASKYPELRLTVLRNDRPKGFGANHNAAFQYSSGAWFLVVNPDIRLPQEGTLSRLLETPALPNIALKAPVVVDPEGELEDAVRSNLTPLDVLRRVLSQRKPKLMPDYTCHQGRRFYWIAGMFMVLDRRAFAKVGGFDERFFLYCEDYDLCARLYNAGYSLQVDRAVEVIHSAQRRSHLNWRYLRWHLGSLIRVWLSRAFWRVTVSSGPSF